MPSKPRSRSKPVCFAETPSGGVYVKVDCLTSLLVVVLDGLPITFMGKRKIPYLAIDTAITWAEKELTFAPVTTPTGKKLQTILGVLRAERDRPRAAVTYIPAR